MSYAYRCGPTATISNRTSWGPVTSPSIDLKTFDRPLSGNFDRIFNSFERTNTYEIVKQSQDKEERVLAHGDVVVNRKMSSSFERADCSLAAQMPCVEDEDYYREKILFSQARQLFPLQEDLADWINKTIGITYLNGENFFDVLDNGVELCQLAVVIHERAQAAVDQGCIAGPVPQIRGRCWQRAARRSFFSRDNTENFITFCKELGVHDNLLFESDDLVLHNQPRQVILCLLEVARLATRYNVEPPGLVALEKEIALEERDSGLDSAMSSAGWQFRDASPVPGEKSIVEPPPSPEVNDTAESTALVETEDARSEGTADSSDSDVPLRPTNELDKRVQLVTRLLERGCRCGAGAGRCSKLLKVKKVGEGRYNIAGRNVFIRLLKGRHMMVRVGGGWDTLEHFLSRHEPCQVRLVTPAARNTHASHVTHATHTQHSGSLHSAYVTQNSSGNSPHVTQSSHDSQNGSSQKVEAAQNLTGKDDRQTELVQNKTEDVVDGKERIQSPMGTESLPRKDVSQVEKRVKSPNGKKVIKDDKANQEKGKPRELTPSPIPSPASSVSGKISPVDKKSRKISPIPGGCKSHIPESRRTSTPNRSKMTLPLRTEIPKRKQSAPSLSTPNTPTGKTKTQTENKNTTSLLPKSRSMSLAFNKNKPFCGTERLNKAKSLVGTPTDTPRKGTQSLATTPSETRKSFCGTDRLNTYAKKGRSMSLASPLGFKPINKSISVTLSGPMTQAAIEESIRRSLAASIEDNSPNKPFLHIKAKYRSPPPREVPPR